jgi:hypothetical protein
MYLRLYNHHIYLMMALRGRNILHESLNYVMIQPITCEVALKTVLCVCVSVELVIRRNAHLDFTE